MKRRINFQFTFILQPPSASPGISDLEADEVLRAPARLAAAELRADALRDLAERRLSAVRFPSRWGVVMGEVLRNRVIDFDEIMVLHDITSTM